MEQTSLATSVATQTVFKRAASIGLILAACFAFSGAQAEAPPVCSAADPHQVRLQVSVSGMRSAAGSIVITVYPDDALISWMAHTKSRARRRR